jgi:hypothetical protein
MEGPIPGNTIPIRRERRHTATGPAADRRFGSRLGTPRGKMAPPAVGVRCSSPSEHSSLPSRTYRSRLRAQMWRLTPNGSRPESRGSGATPEDASRQQRPNESEGVGGESGIRTHGRVSPTHAFQACSFNHSDISPCLESTTCERSASDYRTRQRPSGRETRSCLYSATWSDLKAGVCRNCVRPANVLRSLRARRRPVRKRGPAPDCNLWANENKDCK